MSSCIFGCCLSHKRKFSFVFSCGQFFPFNILFANKIF
nr:hypothetical protein MarFTME_381 [Marseillevirus futianmevirus]